MSDTAFFSFVLFLGSQWGAEPHSISVTKGVENSFSSGSEHPDEDLAKLFDDILLQVFPGNLDDVSKDARTAGRLITWGDANETHLHHNSFNDSQFASSSHKQEEHLAKIFDAYAESLPCRQLLSFLQKNIVIAASAMAAILLVTLLVVLVVVTYIRRKRSRNPPASMTYNIFIMNGKAWWQKSQEKHLRKFTGKQRPMNSNSSI
ncbi:uncharacterized protein C2orf92 homolog [Acomys russatus]|uniref:uncharacterized protein C2orf92 homolog n=1 Tax=Acomys russatus TaxID=60746 RepID=UPI0021E2DF55|nr:uncharacterized protein C2orf92 homolog [Acomys russatus]